MKFNMGYFFIFSIFLNLQLVNADTVNYMVIQNQARPLQIEEYNQNHRGIVTDIVYALFDESPFRLNTNTLPFKQLISDLTSSRYSNWITIGSPGWGGVQAENLSNLPILSVEHRIIVNKGDNFVFNRKSDIDGKTIILLAGFNYPGLEEYIAEKRLKEIRVKNFSAAFKLLKRLGKRACFIEMDLRIKYNQKLLSIDEDDFMSQSFSSMISDYDVYLALDPGINDEIQTFIDTRLELLADGGLFRKVIHKYQ